MTFGKLKTKSQPHFYCLTLDKYFPRTLRNVLRKFSALAALVSFALSFNTLPLYFGKADGLFFLFIFIYLFLSFLEFFYKSMSNEGLSSRINEKLLDKNISLDYALSGILFVTDEIDVTRGFLESKVGCEIFLRSGIAIDSCQNFIHSERSHIMSSSLNLESDFVNLAAYAGALYDADKSLESFLSNNSINREEFVGAAGWVARSAEKMRHKERFWGRENLGAMPSIGSSWPKNALKKIQPATSRLRICRPIFPAI